MRTITVMEKSINKVSKFENVAVNTVQDLKDLFLQKGVSYENTDLYEGLTKQSLTDGELPKNIPFKGKITNDLLIVIYPKKKIESGASRADLYTYIKENNIQEDIKRVFGKNFTNVSTEDLNEFVEKTKGKVDIIEEIERVSNELKELSVTLKALIEETDMFCKKVSAELDNDDIDNIVADLDKMLL